MRFPSTAAFALIASWTTQISAQTSNRSVSAPAVLGTNMAIAGVVAAGRAMVTGSSRAHVAQAFGLGALSGAAEYASKAMIVRQNPPSGWAGVVLGAVGSSLFATANRSVPHALTEFRLPVGPLRVSLSHSNGWRMRMSVNLYDAVVAAAHFADRDLHLDMRKSASSGTFVFLTKRVVATEDDGLAGGRTTGSIVVISELAERPELTARHEYVHVQQYRFLDDAVGRGVEVAVRSRVGALRWIPDWAELGLTVPLYFVLESHLFNRNLIMRLHEAEAEWFERRD